MSIYKEKGWKGTWRNENNCGTVRLIGTHSSFSVSSNVVGDLIKPGLGRGSPDLSFVNETEAQEEGVWLRVSHASVSPCRLASKAPDPPKLLVPQEVLSSRAPSSGVPAVIQSKTHAFWCLPLFSKLSAWLTFVCLFITSTSFGNKIKCSEFPFKLSFFFLAFSFPRRPALARCN